jgi:CDP-diacylglycerol---glycerol-3-phosphate 3-phosphatidyltransferase
VRPPAPDPAGAPATTTRIVNLPNALTALRVLLVPVIAWLLWRSADGGEAARDAAAVLFIIAALTDLADGAIARRYGLVTTFGKVADPIADKALTGVALIGLSLLGQLPWWVTIVILVREIGVTLLRFWVLEHGVIPASRGGKAKTLVQTIAIAMYLADLPWAWWDVTRMVVMGVAVVLTVVTGIDYAVRAWVLRREAVHAI